MQLAKDLFYVFLYGMNTASLSDVKCSLAIGNFYGRKIQRIFFPNRKLSKGKHSPQQCNEVWCHTVTQ